MVPDLQDKWRFTLATLCPYTYTYIYIGVCVVGLDGVTNDWCIKEIALETGVLRQVCLCHKSA